MPEFISYETRASEPIQAGSQTLTLFSKSFSVRIPGLPIGLIWNRPVSILAVSAGGSEQIIPIKDTTRRIVVALFAASMGVALFSLLFQRMQNIQKSDLEEPNDRGQ